MSIADMKLKTIMGVGKITPRKPLHEIVDVNVTKSGVMVAIDDGGDVLFTSKMTGLRPEELKPIISALLKTRWFIKLVADASKRNVEIINVEFSNDGIKFR